MQAGAAPVEIRWIAEKNEASAELGNYGLLNIAEEMGQNLGR